MWGMPVFRSDYSWLIICTKKLKRNFSPHLDCGSTPWVHQHCQFQWTGACADVPKGSACPFRTWQCPAEHLCMLWLVPTHVQKKKTWTFTAPSTETCTCADVSKFCAMCQSLAEPFSIFVHICVMSFLPRHERRKCCPAGGKKYIIEKENLIVV